MRNFSIKTLLKKIWNKQNKESASCFGCELKFSNKEIIFLHFALSLIKRDAITHLNALSKFKSIQYLVEEYYWELIQDSDKLINFLDQEIRKRKIQKTYLDFKMEAHLRKNPSNLKIEDPGKKL